MSKTSTTKVTKVHEGNGWGERCNTFPEALFYNGTLLQEDPVPAESRRYINLANRPAGLPFSDGVLVGDTLYISGRIGLDPATGEAPESVDAEIELLFEGFQAVLREAGMTMDDLVWVQVYSPDVSLWQQFNAAYVKLFSREFPARAFLGSGKLLLKGRFEMLGMAVKGR
jgi:2-iminobutanoate/2-iminopropanoate deaminase